MGVLRPELSRLDQLPSGVWLGPMAAAIAERPDLVRAGLEAPQSLPAGRSRRSMRRFSPTALCSMSRPVLSWNGRSRSSICLGRQHRRLAAHPQPRGRRRGSRATFVESYAGVGDYWRNDVVELRLAAGAELPGLRSSRRARKRCILARRSATLDAASRLSSFVLLLGGRTVRHEVDRAQRGRKEPLRSQRRLSAVGPSGGQHSDDGGSCGAGRRDPRDLQRGSRGAAPTAPFRAASSCAPAPRRSTRIS